MKQYLQIKKQENRYKIGLKYSVFILRLCAIGIDTPLVLIHFKSTIRQGNRSLCLSRVLVAFSIISMHTIAPFLRPLLDFLILLSYH